jgi:thiol-disulfide isomerase/thioredoxin
MRKIILSLTILFSLVLGAIAVSQNAVLAQSKPTVLYIYGQFCGACKQFEPYFDAAKAKFSNKFEFKAEEYNSSAKAREMNVTETPTVFILDGNKARKISWKCLSTNGCFENTLKNY